MGCRFYLKIKGLRNGDVYKTDHIILFFTGRTAGKLTWNMHGTDMSVIMKDIHIQTVHRRLQRSSFRSRLVEFGVAGDNRLAAVGQRRLKQPDLLRGGADIFGTRGTFRIRLFAGNDLAFPQKARGRIFLCVSPTFASPIEKPATSALRRICREIIENTEGNAKTVDSLRRCKWTDSASKSAPKTKKPTRGPVGGEF